jgi:methyl-accepting chemotaxis protein
VLNLANEDKTIELMEKMYSEMQSGFKRVEKKIGNVENEVKKVNFKIENDIETKASALFDGYKQVSEDITEIKDTIKEMADKLENQEVEIRVLKAVK